MVKTQKNQQLEPRAFFNLGETRRGEKALGPRLQLDNYSNLKPYPNPNPKPDPKLI